MLTNEWHEAIEGFLSRERAAGKRTETNSQRRAHLRHLARRVTVGPWAVNADILLDYVAAQTWANETRRGRRTTLRLFYEWGVYRGFVPTNPADDLPKVKAEVPGARPAPDLAYHEALIAARPREKLMLRLAAEVGMRRGEVSRVHSRDLTPDLVGYSLVVHGKGGKQRVVPLPTSLGMALAHAEPGYLFPGDDGGHLSPRWVGKLLRDLIPGEWTMHTLRHRFATRLYAHTKDLLLTQDMLGHASPSTTRRYVRTTLDGARPYLDELAG